MMKEQLKDQANRADPKMDRLQAMAKISETFGYGEKIKGAKKDFLFLPIIFFCRHFLNFLFLFFRRTYGFRQ